MMLVLLLLVSRKVVIDRDVAAAITNGCAYYDDVLYLRESVYFSPQIISVGDPRPVMPGLDSVPSFVTIRHATGWFFARDAVISGLKSVRCILSVVG